MELPMDELSAAPVELPSYAGEGGDTADKGYKCLEKFPLTSPKWTQDVQHGQP